MKHVADKIQAYVSGELAGAEEQFVVDHLAECPACAQEAEQARQLWAVLGEANVLENLTSASAWPDIQARTFGRQSSSVFYGGGLWSKTGIAAFAVAAGLALAVLLPAGSTQDVIFAEDSEALGSSFWLSEQSDTAFSEMWLAVADEGSES